MHRLPKGRPPEDYDDRSDPKGDLRHRVRRQPDWWYDADKPLKRGEADQLRLLPKHNEPSQWHVGHVREGRDWSNNDRFPVIAANCGQPPEVRPERAGPTRMRALDREATQITGTLAAVPEERWSMIPLRCSICWAVLIKRDINDDEGRLPSLPDKTRFCGADCRRAAHAARQARKRRLAQGIRKYPRDDKGWYSIPTRQWFVGGTEPPRSRSGLNVIRPSDPRAELEVRHGIMRGVRRTPMEAPQWWVNTVKLILAA